MTGIVLLSIPSSAAIGDLPREVHCRLWKHRKKFIFYAVGGRCEFYLKRLKVPVPGQFVDSGLSLKDIRNAKKRVDWHHHARKHSGNLYKDLANHFNEIDEWESLDMARSTCRLEDFPVKGRPDAYITSGGRWIDLVSEGNMLTRTSNGTIDLKYLEGRLIRIVNATGKAQKRTWAMCDRRIGDRSYDDALIYAVNAQALLAELPFYRITDIDKYSRTKSEIEAKLSAIKATDKTGDVKMAIKYFWEQMRDLGYDSIVKKMNAMTPDKPVGEEAARQVFQGLLEKDLKADPEALGVLVYCKD